MNNLFFTLLLIIFSSSLFAQKSNDEKSKQKPKSEIHSPRLHALGISATQFGLELNYEYQLDERLSFKTSFATPSFKRKPLSYQANVGMRYDLLKEGRIDVYTGLDYSYIDFNWPGVTTSSGHVFPTFRSQSHNLALPIGIKFNLGERHAFDISTSSTYTLSQNRSDGRVINRRFRPFSELRIGYQFKF